MCVHCHATPLDLISVQPFSNFNSIFCSALLSCLVVQHWDSLLVQSLRFFLTDKSTASQAYSSTFSLEYPSPVPFFSSHYRSPHWAGSIFLFPGVHRLVQQRSPSFVPQRSVLAFAPSPGGRCNYSAGLPLFQGLTDLFLSEVYTRNTLSCSVLSHLFQNFQSYYPTADLSSFPPRARDSKA